MSIAENTNFVIKDNDFVDESLLTTLLRNIVDARRSRGWDVSNTSLSLSEGAPVDNEDMSSIVRELSYNRQKIKYKDTSFTDLPSEGSEIVSSYINNLQIARADIVNNVRCSSGCTAACVSDCTQACRAGCTNNCKTDCTGCGAQCKSACGSGCTGDLNCSACTAYCQASCNVACYGGCDSTCEGGCDNRVCQVSCTTGNCTGGCYGGCIDCGSSSSPSGCVKKGTLVYLDFITTIPVEDLKSGMSILSYNIAANKYVYKKIIRIDAYEVNSYIENKFSDGTVLYNTSDHAFWTGKTWSAYDPVMALRNLKIDAVSECDQLLPGVEVLTVKERVSIKELNKVYKNEVMYNPVIEDTHCYFPAGVLMHNAKDDPSGGL